MTHQPDDLDRRAAQEAAQERGQRRPLYVGALVRILYRCDETQSDWSARTARILREEAYLGVVTAHERDSTWRVDFGDEYLYLHADDVELMT